MESIYIHAFFKTGVCARTTYSSDADGLRDNLHLMRFLI